MMNNTLQCSKGLTRLAPSPRVVSVLYLEYYNLFPNSRASIFCMGKSQIKHIGIDGYEDHNLDLEN